MTTCTPSFKLIKRTPIQALNIEVQQYQHTSTQAIHIHLACEHQEKAFLVAFRTNPKDDTGVAHILEHSVLCGSEKYPVRDPFFMMTRRSLNSFMNAMTSSDWTAYPFASENHKDFNNLLDVYLDAVFFSRLDPLDFAQEGHRLEFNEKSQKLEYKGVVFNEMKGAMSSINSQLWQGVSRYLFPTTTYHYNSGGEPASIPDLSYAQLIDFYKSHYHPSNAIFMSFGEMQVSDLHDKLHNQVLSRFNRQQHNWQVPLERRMPAPVQVSEHYSLDDSDLSGKTHHVLAWLLGESSNLDEQLELMLLSDLLLDNSASPLRKLLETTKLGSAPSSMCGLEDSNREMSFICGLEGSEPEQAQAFAEAVFNCLQEVANNGIAKHVIQASLHQLELQQREIGGDHFPYGLQLMFDALPAAVHHGDVAASLNLQPALERLRHNALKAGFVQEKIQYWLLDNPHYVRYSLIPDNNISRQNERNEQRKLARIQAQLSPKQWAEIEQQTQALKQRQEQVDDPSLLPKVSAKDIQVAVRHIQGEQQQLANLQVHSYQTGTNGLIYQQLISPLAELKSEQWQHLSLLAQAFSQVGVGERDYLQQQQQQTAITGGISMSAIIKPSLDNPNELHRYWCLSGKALASNAQAFSEMMQQTWSQLRLDENTRLNDLLKQSYSAKQRRITGNGHLYAMSLAASQLNVAANVHEQLSGIHHTQALKHQLAQSAQPDLSACLTPIYQTLKQPNSALLIQDSSAFDAHQKALLHSWQNSKMPPSISTKQTWQMMASANYWQVDTQVNFCALAIPSVGIEHPDAPALTLLANILRNGFLHTAIREKGGAYGGGASQDSAHACFKFYSYRDPRLEATFDDFYASIQWFLQLKPDASLIEQALLGTFSSMDKPSSPAGEAKAAFHRHLSGRSDEQRMLFRQNLLDVNWHDLQRVAQVYLQDKQGTQGVLGKRGSHIIGEKMGMIVKNY